ncbi:MAG: helix-turn-helix domain-containing protein, partial [Spirochaetaceae bacterium]|nr:helix-turn-helix domain-containing protein [Spirochaetaceae bacterium]
AEKYFIGYFKKRTGITPARFLTEERLRFAASLLASTRKSVAQIAGESGFADAGYFAKVFRRGRGLSPTEYRDRASGARTGELLVI